MSKRKYEVTCRSDFAGRRFYTISNGTHVLASVTKDSKNGFWGLSWTCHVKDLELVTASFRNSGSALGFALQTLEDRHDL